MGEKIVKLASERNLNKFTFPVKAIKGKPVPEYPIINKYKKIQFLCEQGIFAEKERMIMDIICTDIIHNQYNPTVQYRNDFSKRIPTQKEPMVKKSSSLYITKNILRYFIEKNKHSNSGIIPERYYRVDGSIPTEVDRKYNRMKKAQTIILNDGHLRKQLPFLKKYSSKQIWEMISRTAECKMIINLPIRLFEEEKYHNYHYNNIHCPSKLFTLVGVEASNTAKNGNILERNYEICLDTLLGYFLNQNAISCYTDLLPGHFYEMSSYAQLLYRLLILPYYNGVKIPISFEEIKARLVLKSENYMCRKTIKRILEELEANRFISDINETTKEGTYWYQYTKNKWETITGGI